jgi:hypothetical protein
LASAGHDERRSVLSSVATETVRRFEPASEAPGVVSKIERPTISTATLELAFDLP